MMKDIGSGRKDSFVDGMNHADIIERGRIVQVAYEGQFGKVLRALVNGLISQGLVYHRDNAPDRVPMTAERILGRCEGYQEIIDKLEMMIEAKDQLETPIDEEDDGMVKAGGEY